jgi:ribosomal subunit interface protein
MQILVNGKQLDVGAALRSHVEDRLTSGVNKYFSNPIDAHVVLSREGHSFRTDCSVHVGAGITVQGHATGDEIYACFDAAAERVEKQLRRYKRRLRSHHKNPSELRTAPYYVISPEDESIEDPKNGQPMIIAETTTDIPTTTVSEAVMRMDLANRPVLMFHNSAHGGLNVVYRRSDGNVGWIDPNNPPAA